VQSVNVIEGKKAEQRWEKEPRTLSSSLLKKQEESEKEKYKDTPFLCHKRKEMK